MAFYLIFQLFVIGCRGSDGKCNIFGTQGCNDTYYEKECLCKDGYHDSHCSQCMDFFYPISGNESIIDINGNGVTCSSRWKWLIQFLKS